MLTKEQKIELEKLSKPLIKWLNDNCHPHNQIKIDNTSVELLEGQIMITNNDYIKD